VGGRIESDIFGKGGRIEDGEEMEIEGGEGGRHTDSPEDHSGCQSFVDLCSISTISSHLISDSFLRTIPLTGKG
jgi:hypothetical protein